MRVVLRTLLHYVKRVLIVFLKLLIAIIPKKRNLILFSAWFGKKYADSSMYMYEYLLKSKYEVVWYTLDKSIFNSLSSQKKPVVYGKSLKGVWTQIRAKMLVSSVQFADYNPYFLSRCIYFDLDHGFPIKQSGFEIKGSSKKELGYIKLLRFFIRYYMSSSSEFVMRIISRSFKIKKEMIVKCNKPRTDVLFDKQLRDGHNEIVEKIKDGRKAIVYMPTQRSCGSVPIEICKIFDLKKLNDFCVKNNIVFIIKKHFYHKHEQTDLNKYSNIFDISNEDVETQTLLFQTDLLISDYSACYIDYLLLDRPIILYAYDYDAFLKNERELYLNFDDNSCGFKAYTFNQCFEQITNILKNNWDDALGEGRKQIRNLYFSNSLTFGHAREEITAIIGQLLSKKYNAQWEVEE